MGAVSFGGKDFIHQRVGMGEQDAVALLQGVQGDGIGQMCFTHAGFAQKDDVFMFLDEATGAQVVNEAFVQFGLKGEVIGVEGFALLELRFEQALAIGVGFAAGALIFNEQFKELQIGQLIVQSVLIAYG